MQLLEKTKAPKDDTAGKGWFHMEQAEMTPELKRDLQVGDGVLRGMVAVRQVVKNRHKRIDSGLFSIKVSHSQSNSSRI